MYSAVKHQGKPLYRLARAGIEVVRKPRRREIFRLEVVDWKPPLITLEVECAKGTYIRSLAHDLGESLGCGAHLKSLVRLKSGIFDIKEGVTVPQLEEAFQRGYWQDLLYPIDVALLHLTAVILGEDHERSLRSGRPLELGQLQGKDQAQLCRAYSLDGRIIGVLWFDPERSLWQPKKVFPPGLPNCRNVKFLSREGIDIWCINSIVQTYEGR